MKGITFLLFFSVSALLPCFGQRKAVHLHYDKANRLAYYQHNVEKQQTLYSISKTYGSSVDNILAINELEFINLSLGQMLIIPFENGAIHYRPAFAIEDRIPVYYDVKRKETVFGICPTYFKINMSAVKEANHLRRNRLKTNQRIRIGYLKRPHSAENSTPTAPEQDVVIEDRRLEDLAVPMLLSTDTLALIDSIKNQKPNFDSIEMEINSERGAAFWNKSSADMNGQFVLHRHAKINSWIEITNPMFDVKLMAKVIGNIPSTGYPDDVLVVVSPSIAKELGALDARFYVKMRYLRPQVKMTNGK